MRERTNTAPPSSGRRTQTYSLLPTSSEEAAAQVAQDSTVATLLSCYRQLDDRDKAAVLTLVTGLSSGY